MKKFGCVLALFFVIVFFVNANANMQPRCKIALSKDAKYLTASGDTLSQRQGESTVSSYPIKLYDVTSGNLLKTFLSQSALVESLAFSPDGKILAAGLRDGSIQLWDVLSGNSIATLNGHQSYVLDLTYSPDGRILVSASYDKTVKAWTIESGSLIATITEKQPVQQVVFTNDGEELIVRLGLSFESETLIEASIKNYKIPECTLLQERSISGLGDIFGAYYIPPNGNGDAVFSAIDIGSDDDGKDISVSIVGYSRNEEPIMVNGRVYNVAITNDGKQLYYTLDNSIIAFDTVNKKEIKRLPHDNITSLLYNSVGNIVVSSSSDYVVKIWSTNNLNNIKTIIIKPKSSP
jgi:WD40 repeat protein